MTSLPQHIEEEAGGRVRRARHEHRDVFFLARQLRRDVGARRRREEHQRPHAGRREIRPARRCGRTSRTSRTASRTPASGRDRSAARSARARGIVSPISTSVRPTRLAVRKPSMVSARNAMIRPKPGHLDRQIGLRPVGDRDERPHQVVDPGDERPDQPDRDRDRPGDDQPGQEIGADAAARRRDAAPARAAAAAPELSELLIEACGLRPAHPPGIWRPLYEKQMADRHSPYGDGGMTRPDCNAAVAYSTVTDLARLRGWSTSVPIMTAV